MKKVLAVLLAAVLCVLAGCGGTEKAETEKETKREETKETEGEVTNLYQGREMQTVACDNVTCQIPATIMVSPSGEWTYYYYGDSFFSLNVTGADGLDNEGLIEEKATFIEGMAAGGGVPVSDAVVEVSGEKALELVMTLEANGKEYDVYSLNFIYDSMSYSLGWMIDKASGLENPAETYEIFKGTVAIEEHAETDASGDPTSWKLLNDLRKKNKNLSHVVVYNEETDPNGAMGQEGAYITKASFSDARMGQGGEPFDGGTIETFLSEEDCGARAENLESQTGPDMGVLQLKQYIYRHGKILFRVSMELPEAQADEYDKQLEELLLEYEGKISPEDETEAEEETEESEETEAPEETEETETAEETEKDDLSPTIGEQNALKSAIQYLKIMPFSYTGLIEQLEYEKYSHEEAVYAADHCGADWNEQAVKSAKKYLDLMSFSRGGLIDQLEYEGYTHEQAVYGVEQNGY